MACFYVITFQIFGITLKEKIYKIKKVRENPKEWIKKIEAIKDFYKESTLKLVNVSYYNKNE